LDMTIDEKVMILLETQPQYTHFWGYAVVLDTRDILESDSDQATC